MSSLLAALLRRAPPVPPLAPRFPYTLETNPYRCKRIWPPDFTKLSQKHQFRLERRYRRRAKLAWARPEWTKGVTLVQWGAILFVLVYGVFWMDIDGRRTPFDGVRQVIREQTYGVSSEPAPPTRKHDNSPLSTA